MTPYPVYLLRHGQTEWNLEGRLQGSLDSPLTERGIRQAHNMAATLNSVIDRRLNWRLVSSPQPRAFDTASIVSRICNLPLKTDERLREASFGVWEGFTDAEIKTKWPDQHGTCPFLGTPGGETLEQVSARAEEWLGSIMQPTIAISHGSTGKVIRSIYLGVSPEEIPSSASANQDGMFYLLRGEMNFLQCIEHCDEPTPNLPPAPRRDRVEPR